MPVDDLLLSPDLHHHNGVVEADDPAFELEAVDDDLFLLFCLVRPQENVVS